MPLLFSFPALKCLPVRRMQTGYRLYEQGDWVWCPELAGETGMDCGERGNAMQLNITARHMELTDGLRSHIEKELKKLERHFHKEAEIQVTLCVEKYRHIAEVSCNVGGHVLQSKEETKDMYQSVDRSIESVGKQFKRFKSKHWEGKGKSGLQDEHFMEVSAAGTEGEEQPSGSSRPRIIRSPKYAVKPMSVDEAAMQMDLLDKDFIVYTDSTSEQVNVLYRRKDGNLGLIEPIYE